MPDPQDGSFHYPGPKGPPARASVKVGEEVELRLTPFTQLQLRVQCLERAIACSPFCFHVYNKELERVGLRKLDMQETV